MTDTTDTAEKDLIDAMNAALLEDGSESGHASLLSVDVMDEAMLLLSGDADLASGNGEEDDNNNDDDDDEEEINFEDFLKPPINDEKKEDPNKQSTIEKSTTTTDTAETKDESPKLEEPQVVPLKQFENALALIQDLENRIAVLETDHRCLVEENEELRDTTNKQASAIADMEHKLARFPKLLEQTVQEESKLAAAQAEAETKSRFWERDIARQHQQEREEKQRKSRVGKHVATTDSLKQSDFLAQVVERKELESPKRGVRPVAIFNAIRGFGSRVVSHPNSNATTIPSLPSKGSSEDVVNGDSEFVIGDEEDDADNTNVLDLMT